jgi:hypothetical protein
MPATDHCRYLAAVRRTLEAVGIEFMFEDDGGLGLRRSPGLTLTLEKLTLNKRLER